MTPSSVVAVTYNHSIGSDGCVASLSTSDTASDNVFGVLSMSYRRRSTRHTVAHWKRLENKTGNMRTDSSSVSQQLPVHFASRSSQTFSHLISTLNQFQYFGRIGARTQRTPCDLRVPVCFLSSMWTAPQLFNSRIFR